MSPAINPVRVNRLQCLQIPLQVVMYVGVFIFSEYLVEWLNLPLPASIVGMLLMLVLIMSHILPLRWVKAGASWLLAEMLLFFIPAVVAVINYAQLLLVEGWRIFLVIAISTSLVLGATALVVDRVYHIEIWLRKRKRAHRA